MKAGIDTATDAAVDKVKDRLVIRPAVSGDARTMREIDQACFEPSVAYPEEVFYYHLLILNDPAFVAHDGNKMAGFVITSLENGVTGLIVTIDVLSRWRRRGLGARLMQRAEEALESNGITSINLQVAVNNAPAIAFYEKLGYRRIRRIIDYYGAGKDAYLFKRPLAKK